MTKYLLSSIFIFIIIILTYSCSSIKNKKQKEDLTTNAQDSIQLDFKSGPPTIIYKTKNDYTEFVPVTLSEDKTTIVSFPHPKDLFHNGELSFPTELSEGYLLDNRGIDTNVAFLNMSYKDYSLMGSPPDPDSLITKILDDEPLLEFFNCGNKYIFKDVVKELNQLIENKQLDQCKCLISKSD